MAVGQFQLWQQENAMEDAELRLKCLELAASLEKEKGRLIDLAEKFDAFVARVIPDPGKVRKPLVA